MAVDAIPLFVADKTTLKASLRLGGIINEDAADDILNDSMLRARTLIIRILGSNAVAKILAIPTTATPTTVTEVRRVEAEQLEIIMVKRHLIEDLPTAFMDDSGSMLDTYAKEAPFRLTDSTQRNAWIQSLELRSNSIAGRLVSDLRAETSANEFSHSLGVNGVGAVLLGPDREAPTLSPREGHISATSLGNANHYNRHRALWHR